MGVSDACIGAEVRPEKPISSNPLIGSESDDHSRKVPAFGVPSGSSSSSGSSSESNDSGSERNGSGSGSDSGEELPARAVLVEAKQMPMPPPTPTATNVCSGPSKPLSEVGRSRDALPKRTRQGGVAIAEEQSHAINTCVNTCSGPSKPLSEVGRSRDALPKRTRQGGVGVAVETTNQVSHLTPPTCPDLTPGTPTGSEIPYKVCPAEPARPPQHPVRLSPISQKPTALDSALHPSRPATQELPSLKCPGQPLASSVELTPPYDRIPQSVSVPVYASLPAQLSGLRDTRQDMQRDTESICWEGSDAGNSMMLGPVGTELLTSILSIEDGGHVDRHDSLTSYPGSGLPQHHCCRSSRGDDRRAAAAMSAADGVSDAGNRMLIEESPPTALGISPTAALRLGVAAVVADPLRNSRSVKVGEPERSVCYID